MTGPAQFRTVTVLCCREEGDGVDLGGDDADGVADILAACAGAGADVHVVGRRPTKTIDALLAGRVVVVGDDGDLAAVVLRLLRKDLLGEVEVAFAPVHATAVTRLYGLATGTRAVEAARGPASEVPLVRSDAGGVLVGAARLSPVTGTVYVDEHRVLSGSAEWVDVVPDPARGVAVTMPRRRAFGLGRRSVTTLGRAVEFGLAGDCTIVSDGVAHPRRMQRWVFYRHTEPLRLVR